MSGYFSTEIKEQNGLKNIAGRSEFCYPVRRQKSTIIQKSYKG
jgi:hypothetical protein